MQIEVLLFAAARDAAGSDSIQVDVEEDALAEDVMAAIGRQLPEQHVVDVGCSRPGVLVDGAVCRLVEEKPVAIVDRVMNLRSDEVSWKTTSRYSGWMSGFTNLLLGTGER